MDTFDHDSATLDVIAAQSAGTLAGLFRQRCERTPDGIAYRAFREHDSTWQTYSWANVSERVARWQRALAREQLTCGDRVAVLAPNGIDWVCFDLAAQHLGLVLVALYTVDSPGNTVYVLGDSGARVLLVSEPAAWQVLAPRQSEFPHLSKVISIAPGLTGPRDGHPSVTLLADWLSAASNDPPPASPGRDDPEATATIIYTSGTTGRPKGVMLTHRNILSNAQSVLEFVPGYREDVFLSFLPLSHAFERTVGYYLPIMTGSTVAYARSVEQLAEDLLSIRPTLLVSVPRVYERVYGRVLERLESKGAVAKRLFALATNMGWRRFEAAQQRRRPAIADRLLWPVLRYLVARPLLARLGGRLRIALCGGAPLEPSVARCFIGLGLSVIQGYGLTEAAPIVTTNVESDNVPESVGRPIPGVEVALGKNDELLLRSPGVMAGYWNRPRETATAVDTEGWLHTGDQAKIDGGYIYITGRIKDIIVLSTGEKIAPGDVERALCGHPLIIQAMVVGESKPYLGALLVVDANRLQEHAPTLGLSTEDPLNIDDKRLRDHVVTVCNEQLCDMPAWAQVRRVRLMPDEWTVGNGLLTPTLKLKRAALTLLHAEKIAQLHTDHELPA